MKIRKIFIILAAAVVLVSAAVPALAENRALDTAILKGMDRTVSEWMTGSGNRELFASVAMVDLVLTAGKTEDKDNVFSAMSSAMIDDKCYVGISNGGSTISALFFGEKHAVIIFYTPSLDLGEWSLIEGATADTEGVMSGLKEGGVVESYYKVSGKKVLEIIQEVSQGLGN